MNVEGYAVVKWEIGNCVFQIGQRLRACCKGTFVVLAVIYYFVRKVMKMKNGSFEMWVTSCVFDSTQSFPGANSYYSGLAD